MLPPNVLQACNIVLQPIIYIKYCGLIFSKKIMPPNKKTGKNDSTSFVACGDDEPYITYSPRVCFRGESTTSTFPCRTRIANIQRVDDSSVPINERVDGLSRPISDSMDRRRQTENAFRPISESTVSTGPINASTVLTVQRCRQDWNISEMHLNSSNRNGSRIFKPPNVDCRYFNLRYCYYSERNTCRWSIVQPSI